MTSTALSPALRAQVSAASKAMWWGSMCAHPTITLWVIYPQSHQVELHEPRGLSASEAPGAAGVTPKSSEPSP